MENKKVVLGVDIGGSTTKVVLLRASGKASFYALQVRANDQLTALYGAIGHALHETGLALADVEKLVLTGVGAALVKENIYGIPTFKVEEFSAIAKGGCMLAGLEPLQQNAMVMSMGTGTAFVEVAAGTARHIGGSGVGGGTLLGLAGKMLGVTNIETLVALAAKGNLANVDLSIGEISTGAVSNLPPEITAANFANIKPTAAPEDFALGLFNMVYQTAGMLAVFACRGTGIQKVVATGAVASLPQANTMLNEVGALYGLEFVVPENATFATALGAAALSY